MDPADWDHAIPPAVTIVRDPITTVRRSIQIVEITNGNRISGVNFGIPKPRRVFGSEPSTIQLPDTGDGASRPASTLLLALAAGITACIAGTSMLAIQRRRRR